MPRRAPTAAGVQRTAQRASRRLAPLWAVIYQHTGGSAPHAQMKGRTPPNSVCPSVRPARGGACPPGAAGAAGGGGPVPHITLPRCHRLPSPPAPLPSALRAMARPLSPASWVLRGPSRPWLRGPVLRPAALLPLRRPARPAEALPAAEDAVLPECAQSPPSPSLAAIAPSRLLPRGRAGSHAAPPPLSPPRMRVSLLSPLLLLSLSAGPHAAELPLGRAKCPARCDVSTCPSPSCPSGYVPDRCGCCLICAAGEGDSCGRKEDPPCGDSLDCRYPMGKRFAKGVCQCKLSAQVCGSDGRTYDNICQLKAVSRKALQHGLPAVAQVQKGACESGRSMVGPVAGRGEADLSSRVKKALIFTGLGRLVALGTLKTSKDTAPHPAAIDTCGMRNGCLGAFRTAKLGVGLGWGLGRFPRQHGRGWCLAEVQVAAAVLLGQEAVAPARWVEVARLPGQGSGQVLSPGFSWGRAAAPSRSRAASAAPAQRSARRGGRGAGGVPQAGGMERSLHRQRDTGTPEPGPSMGQFGVLITLTRQASQKTP